jgi:hypothetical protein
MVFASHFQICHFRLIHTLLSLSILQGSYYTYTYYRPSFYLLYSSLHLLILLSDRVCCEGLLYFALRFAPFPLTGKGG